VSVKAEFYGIEKDLLLHSLILIFSGTIFYILCIIKDRRKIILIILLIIFILSSNRTSSTPIWMKDGVYAKYKSEWNIESIVFENKTVIDGNWTLYFMWKCINITLKPYSSSMLL